DLDVALPLEKSPRVEHDFRELRVCESREPGDDGAGHEVGILGFENAVAAAAHRWSPKRQAEPAGQCAPRRSLGTRANSTRGDKPGVCHRRTLSFVVYFQGVASILVFPSVYTIVCHCPGHWLQLG